MDNMTLAGGILASYLFLAVTLNAIASILRIFILEGILTDLRWYAARDMIKRMSEIGYNIFAWWTIGGIVYAYIIGISVWKHWGFF